MVPTPTACTRVDREHARVAAILSVDMIEGITTVCIVKLLIRSRCVGGTGFCIYVYSPYFHGLSRGDSRSSFGLLWVCNTYILSKLPFRADFHRVVQILAKADTTGKLREELKTTFMPEILKTPLYSAVCSDDPLIFDEVLTQIKSYMEEMDYGTLNSSTVSV